MSEPFSIELPVRWGDMDALGHVNNTQFLRYLEECRIGWFETLDGGWMDERMGPVVASIRCDFRRPIHHPATVRVTLAPEAASARRLVAKHTIVDVDDGAVYAEAEITIVWVDIASGRAIELPPQVTAALG